MPPWLRRFWTPAKEALAGIWAKYTDLLPGGLRNHAIPITLGVGVLFLTLFLLVAAMVGGGGKSKPLPRRALPSTQAAPLRNYHLSFETNLADPAAREHIIRPEELPVRQERHYLEENLGKSRLFDQAELQIQAELNRRTR